MTDRRGFTLVELLVVAVVGTLLVMVAYQVLITNQRTYTAQNTRVQLQQTTRASLDVLFSELREVSAAGGDIVDYDPAELTVRAMRQVGTVCETYSLLFATTPQLMVRRIDEEFAAGDSVFIFADNDEFITADDRWILGQATTADTTQVCPGTTHEAALMTFVGQSVAFLADTVRDGAPVRSFTRYTYGLMEYDGQSYLGRSENNGAWSPLVGPLTGVTGRPGLEFDYFDSAGNTPASAADIRRVAVTIRSFSNARGPAGEPIVDSLSASIHMRN